MSRQEYANNRKSFPCPDPDSSTTEQLGKVIVRKSGERFTLIRRDREKAEYRSDKGRHMVFRRQFTKCGRGDDFLFRELFPTKATEGYCGDKEVADLNYRRMSL